METQGQGERHIGPRGTAVEVQAGVVRGDGIERQHRLQRIARVQLGEEDKGGVALVVSLLLRGARNIRQDIDDGLHKVTAGGRVEVE